MFSIRRLRRCSQINPTTDLKDETDITDYDWVVADILSSISPDHVIAKEAAGRLWQSREPEISGNKKLLTPTVIPAKAGISPLQE